jgi:hypothetical protein
MVGNKEIVSAATLAILRWIASITTAVRVPAKGRTMTVAEQKAATDTGTTEKEDRKGRQNMKRDSPLTVADVERITGIVAHQVSSAMSTGRLAWKRYGHQRATTIQWLKEWQRDR